MKVFSHNIWYDNASRLGMMMSRSCGQFYGKHYNTKIEEILVSR